MTACRRFAAVACAFVIGGCARAASPAPDPGAPAAIPNLAGKVLTVRGPIDPASLGPTLMHEHIFINFKKPPAMIPPPTDIHVLRLPPPVPDAKPSFGLTDFKESLAEVSQFRKIGGGTIVDVSNFGLTRDPAALLRVSKASGLHVVMGSGWYQKALHPPDMDSLTVEQLTRIVVHDVTIGAQGTTIRAGIIGEVGVNGRPLVANELKSVRASARAARITGAPMMIHSFATPDEMQIVLDTIAAEGVPLSRVVLAHVGSGNVERMRKYLERGVFVEFDYMGQAPLPPAADSSRIANIAKLIRAGYIDQILVSHDICTKAQLKRYGGGGYTYISTVILPGLRKLGISETDLHTLLIDNPRRVLTFVAPG